MAWMEHRFRQAAWVAQISCCGQFVPWISGEGARIVYRYFKRIIDCQSIPPFWTKMQSELKSTNRIPNISMCVYRWWQCRMDPTADLKSIKLPAPQKPAQAAYGKQRRPCKIHEAASKKWPSDIILASVPTSLNGSRICGRASARSARIS